MSNISSPDPINDYVKEIISFALSGKIDVIEALSILAGVYRDSDYPENLSNFDLLYDTYEYFQEEGCFHHPFPSDSDDIDWSAGGIEEITRKYFETYLKK